jgi:hypothetical protein
MYQTSTPLNDKAANNLPVSMLKAACPGAR